MPRWLHDHLKYFYYLQFNAYNKANLFFGVLSQFCQHYCSHNGGKYLLPPKKYLSQCMARTKMPTCQKIPILRNAENKKKKKLGNRQKAESGAGRYRRRKRGSSLSCWALGQNQASGPLISRDQGRTQHQRTALPPPPPPLSSEVSATITSLSISL
jgi:hypothetical protein